MRPGQIVIDGVSQRFRISTQPYRTLKDLFISRGRSSVREVQALRDVSLSIEPGEGVALVGRNGSGKSTLLRTVSRIFRPTSGRIEVGGRVASLLELGAGFHPEFSGRENVYLNGSIHGLSRARIRESMDEIIAFAELERAIDLPLRTYSSGMYMRLGFSVAAHIDADILLLDEVFAVGDESFQRKCLGKIHEFKRRGGTIVFVSHDAQAVERLCERAVLLEQGEVAFDGPARETIARYRQLSAGDRSPEELSAGLREWGSGEARILSVKMLDSDGDERRQYAAGEPFVVELRIAAERGLAAPSVSLELRDDAGSVLAGTMAATGELGWDAVAGERTIRFELEKLPLAGGRFHLRCGLIAAGDDRILHSVGDAAQFFVLGPPTETGPLFLDGRWTVDEARVSAPAVPQWSSRSCPDWPLLMELAPELQFKHYTLRETKLDVEAFVNVEGVGLDDDEVLCCDLESHVFNSEHTDPTVAEALRASHWFDLREWATRPPGAGGG